MGLTIPAIVATAVQFALDEGLGVYGAVFFGACLVYAAGLTAGIWQVRPAEKRARWFPWLLAPVLVQAAFYGLFWFDAVAGAKIALEGHMLGAGALFLAVGPLLPLGLLLFARRGLALFLVELFGPLAVLGTLFGG